MVYMLYKWLCLVLLPFWGGFSLQEEHPIYVSVSEIEYLPASQRIEVSCKVFTDDLEQVLREQKPGATIDLLNAAKHQSMKPIVGNYVQTHFQLRAGNQPVTLRFLDYEQEEEGIVCYLEADRIAPFGELHITNSLLYERSTQQMGIMHVLKEGKRQSLKLNHPHKTAHCSL
jgi:hypothetical protein